MSFLGHLEVFRWHLIRSLAAVLVFTILAFLNKSLVFDKLLLGPLDPDFLTYRWLCNVSIKLHLGEALCIREIPFRVINIYLSGQFVTHITVSAIAGLIAASPYVFFELWRFVKPALREKEKSHSRGIVIYSSLLFLTGVLFGYYILSPMMVFFLGSYQVSETVSNLIHFGSYISTVASMILICGVIFELPVATYILTKAGLLTPAIMTKYRKHAVVAILIVAAIITPPDVASQVLIAFPLWLLYEVSIIVCRGSKRG